MRPPSNPAYLLSTNRAAAGQLCPVAMETQLLIFCRSLTLIRDRSCTVEKSMGHSSSKYTAVQQQEKTEEFCCHCFFWFADCGGSLINSPLCRSSAEYFNLVGGLKLLWALLNIRTIQLCYQVAILYPLQNSTGGCGIDLLFATPRGACRNSFFQ